MTDLEIKAAVRERDGYRCRDCGMTSEEHLAQHGRELDVHRVLPGADYDPDTCVTLCRACHGPKPRTLAEAFFWDRERTRVDFVFWNMYKPEEADLVRRLEHLAEEQGIDAGRLIDNILWKYCHGEPLNYCI
jgi:hypothetical protein